MAVLRSLVVLPGADACVQELAKLGECSWGGGCLIGGFAWDGLEELVKTPLRVKRKLLGRSA